MLVSLCQDSNILQEVKVDGGEFGLNQSPETPEEMRCLETEERGLAHAHCIYKVNVVYIEIDDTETRLLLLSILHAAVFSS